MKYYVSSFWMCFPPSTDEGFWNCGSRTLQWFEYCRPYCTSREESINFYEIFCLLGGKDSGQGLLGCNTVYCYGTVPEFWRTFLPPSSPWRKYISCTTSKECTAFKQHSTVVWLMIFNEWMACGMYVAYLYFCNIYAWSSCSSLVYWLQCFMTVLCTYWSQPHSHSWSVVEPWCEIWGFHSTEDSRWGLPGCDII